MKESFRQSMAWLHTWSGLVVGWVLLAIFVTGTASYFRPEITLWMQPELQASQKNPDAATLAMKRLDELAPTASSWFINLPDERNPALQIGWREAGKKGRFQRETLDAGTGEKIEARETRGGEFFYRFHFQLNLPPLWGRWIVGACAMSMLVALISGVVTHRRIFKDFFTFRPKKGQRSWLDAHNASGVLALPFHLMITYTGLVTLMYLYMPWGVATVYHGDRDAFFDAFNEKTLEPEASGVPAPMAAIAPLLASAEKDWQGGRIGRITVDHPNDANALIRIARHDGDHISTHGEEMVFNGVSGALLSNSAGASGVKEVHGVFYGLHVARFAEPLLRWLFFLCGLSGCAMVATGLLLWSVARAPQLKKAGRASVGHRLVDALNISAVAGLPLAVAGFFWANRLLPAQFPERSGLEVQAFFLLWLLVPFYAGLRPSQRAWKEVMGMAALLFATLPLLNALTTDTHLGITLPAGQWAFAGFDLVMIFIGLLLGAAAWKLGRWQPVAKKRPARQDNSKQNTSQAQASKEQASKQQLTTPQPAPQGASHSVLNAASLPEETT